MSAFWALSEVKQTSARPLKADFRPLQEINLTRYADQDRALGDGMRRREFLGVLSGAAAWPIAARAQQADRMRRIGVLFADFDSQQRIKAFESSWPTLGW